MQFGISSSLFLSLCLPLCPPLSLSPLPFPPLCSSEGLFFFPPSLLLPLHRSLSFSLSHPFRRCWNFFVVPSPSPYSVNGWLKPGVTHYNALKHTAARCSTLQHTAMHCNAAVYCVCCSVLQLLKDESYKTFQECVGDLLTLRTCAVCCSVLQRVAACCSMLQRVAATVSRDIPKVCGDS